MGDRRFLEGDWVKKNIVSIISNVITIIVILVGAAMFLARIDAKVTENRESLVEMQECHETDVGEIKEQLVIHEGRIDAEEVFRAEAITRLDYISVQLDRFYEELKERRSPP